MTIDELMNEALNETFPCLREALKQNPQLVTELAAMVAVARANAVNELNGVIIDAIVEALDIDDTDTEDPEDFAVQIDEANPLVASVVAHMLGFACDLDEEADKMSAELRTNIATRH